MARTAPDGSIVPLAEQDRVLWDRDAIEDGVELVSRALSRGSLRPYQLQAAIAAAHAGAAVAEDTGWPEILALYNLLERVSPGPIITLNRAVATSLTEQRHLESRAARLPADFEDPPASSTI